MNVYLLNTTSKNFMKKIRSIFLRVLELFAIIKRFRHLVFSRECVSKGRKCYDRLKKKGAELWSSVQKTPKDIKKRCHEKSPNKGIPKEKSPKSPKLTNML